MNIKPITILAVWAALLSACQQGEYDAAEGNANYPQDGMVRIATLVDAPSGTRATSTYAGTSLGLSLVPASGNPTYTYNNEEWTTADNGLSWTTAKQLLWQSATTSYHIHAYAPHCATMSADGVITHTIASDQSVEGAWLASDLVGYTTKADSDAPTFTPGASLTAEGKLPLTMSHRLSQLTVNCTMRSEWDGTNVSIKAVHIINTPTTVSYNTVSGTVSDVGTTFPIIMAATATAQSYKAIIAPVAISAGTQLVQIVMSNGDVYQYAAGAYAFAPGKGYVLNLAIGKDWVELAGDIQITDWEDATPVIPEGGAGYMDREQIYAYSGDMTDFPTDPATIPYDTWYITPSTVDASLANVKATLTALNGTSRRIALVINGVETVADNAFSYCLSLSSVSLPSATSIGDYAFWNCSALSSVSLPSATSIGDFAFRDCSALSSVSLPSATSIGRYAFECCTSLSSVSLPSATSIGDFAFRDCSALSSVSLPQATSIGIHAFRGCSVLSSVTLPSVTSIKGLAFFQCFRLSSVSLPQATSIGNYAFSQCSVLSSVSLPSATSIGDDAFSYCSSLSSVSLPSATSIEGYAFFQCSVLSSVSLPSATSIGDNAFRGCSVLSSVSLPSATSIGDNAFRGCSALSSVSLPSVMSIGDSPFEGCTSLKTLFVATNAGVIVGSLASDFGSGFLTGEVDLTIGRSEATDSGATEEGKAWRGYTFKSIKIAD